jgi:hypothetical protein
MILLENVSSGDFLPTGKAGLPALRKKLPARLNVVRAGIEN